MSASVEILIESQPNVLMVPVRSSIMHKGQPAVYLQRGERFEIRTIKAGKRNENDLIVVSGLNEGDVVALENPAEAAKRARKL